MATSTNQLFETQKLLRSFRVAELKELLRSLKVSTSGRKKDLMDRVELLLQTDTPGIHKKVKEIFSKNFKSLVSTPKTPPRPPITCTSNVAPPNFHVKFPDVKLKPHPFYQQVDTIVKPTYLVSETHRHYKDEMMVVEFHLSPTQIQQIFMSETTPGNYQTQVILRLCRRETSCEQEDFCPMKCNLRINKNHCPIPGYNPELSCKPDYKYQMKPLNITSYVHTSPALSNTITVSWNNNVLYPQGFCIAVQLSRALSPAELLQSLRGRASKSTELSKALVREKLAIGRDDDISTTSLRVSLICPLGKMKMSYPCRAVSCSHLQCFDALTYLQLNQKKASWICPVCDRRSHFNDLIIDDLMKDICDQTKANETEIEFLSDASWQLVNKSESKITYSLMNSNSPVIITDSPSQGNNRTGGTTTNDNNSKPIVIDLTLDSSEDDEDNQPVILRPNHSSPPPLPRKQEPSSPSLLVPPSPPSLPSFPYPSLSLISSDLSGLFERFSDNHFIFSDHNILNQTNSRLLQTEPSDSRLFQTGPRLLQTDSSDSRLFQPDSNTSGLFQPDSNTSRLFQPDSNISRLFQTDSNDSRLLQTDNTNNSRPILSNSSQHISSNGGRSNTAVDRHSTSNSSMLPRQSVIQSHNHSDNHWVRRRSNSRKRHFENHRKDMTNKRKHYVPIHRYDGIFSSSESDNDD